LSNCDNCPSKEGCTSQENCTIENNPYNHIKCVIGVMSGKGGVGKSTISTMLARTLNVRGHSVGIMDADITGPSIPRLLSIENTKVRGSELGIIPVKSPEGIEVISLNLFMEDEEQPVIWRGPLIAGAVKQFWTDVLWGNLDYLIIDLPPGTGDVALTVMQSIPINGMVMVSTPQDMVSMIVAKSINMVKTMNIPILGVVENMSYMICPQCGKKIDIFGDSNIDIFLDRQDIKLLGKLPMSKDLASVAENNENNMQNDIINTFNSIIDKIDSSLNL